MNLLTEKLLNRALKQLIPIVKQATQVTSREVPVYVRELLQYEAYKEVLTFIGTCLLLLGDLAFLTGLSYLTLVAYPGILSGAVNLNTLAVPYWLGWFVGLAVFAMGCAGLESGIPALNRFIKILIAPRVAGVDLIRRKISNKSTTGFYD